MNPTIIEPLPYGLTAVEAFQSLSHWPNCIFFDSARTGAAHGMTSYIAADPFEWFCVPATRHHDVQSTFAASLSNVSTHEAEDNTLASLAERLEYFSQPTLAGLPSFQGGAAGLISYDYCHRLEHLPHACLNEFGVPDFAIGMYDWVLAFDHLAGESWIISTGFPEMDLRRRRVRAAERLKRVMAEIENSGPESATRCDRSSNGETIVEPEIQTPILGIPGLTSNFTRDHYLRAVEKGMDYINAGDLFQVNLSQRLLFPANRSPQFLYQRLRQCNSAPFAGYFDIGDFVVLSASPERFLRVRGDRVETRPIKGTRHRSLNPEADLFTRDALRESEKDSAENIMIVDLLRNDLSKVCEPSSIRVPQLCEVEGFEYVLHLVSEVEGRLRPENGPIDVLAAAFPGGSITGAPKVRACEVIAELEPSVRGPYCGCLAYIGFDRSMDTSILIRTMTYGKGWIQMPVGGGIVAQSNPQQEYEETLDKAEGMLRALF